LNGMQISMPTTKNITVGTGLYTATGTPLILAQSASALTKVIVNAGATAYEPWVAGTGNGGVVIGPAIGDKNWLHVFAILNPSTLVTDICCDSSITAAGILGGAPASAGYTYYRRIGSICLNGSSGSYYVRPYTQIGDRFVWKDIKTNVTGEAPVQTFASSASLQVKTYHNMDMIYVPTGVKVSCTMSANWWMGYATYLSGVIYLYDPDTTDNASMSSDQGQLRVYNQTTPSVLAASCELTIMTNTSRQIRGYAINGAYVGTGNDPIFWAVPTSYVDNRGKDTF
jgi:hypothetical protein